MTTASTPGLSPQSAEIATTQAHQIAGPELLTFAVHRDPAVRAIIAARADCPTSALISLGHDHALEVLEALLANPRTPESVVRKLADHRDPGISEQAVQRLRNSSL